MKDLIPGHVAGITWAITLVLSAVVYWITGSLQSVIGSVVLVAGFFLADQATHLAQEAHSAPPSNWVEQMLQKYHWPSIILGLVLVALGSYWMLAS